MVQTPFFFGNKGHFETLPFGVLQNLEAMIKNLYFTSNN